MLGLSHSLTNSPPYGRCGSAKSLRFLGYLKSEVSGFNSPRQTFILLSVNEQEKVLNKKIESHEQPLYSLYLQEYNRRSYSKNERTYNLANAWVNFLSLEGFSSYNNSLALGHVLVIWTK